MTEPPEYGTTKNCDDSTEVTDRIIRSRCLTIYKVLGKSAEFCFMGLVALMLATPSWRYGIFTWSPIFRLPSVAGAPVTIGVLNLLLPCLVITWISKRFLAWKAGQRHNWNIGKLGITLPLAILTGWGFLRLDLGFPRVVFIQAGALILFWLFYLFLLNEHPRIIFPLTLVVVIQSGIALAQFFKQEDLGLRILGELPLNPIHSGVSVLFVSGKRWLRGYGFTAHPNLLGALLTTILLILLPAFKLSTGKARISYSIVYGVGILGLFATFSRAATIALVAGLIACWLYSHQKGHFRFSTLGLKDALRSPIFYLVVMIVFVFLFLFADLTVSRLQVLDSPLELISVNQRLADAQRAVALIADNLFLGVGLGQYTNSAKEIDPVAVIVHNVPLLVTAELGILGFLLLSWMTISGLRSRPAGLVPWLAVLIIGFFDITLWLTSSWQTAILFAFITANISQDITRNQGEDAEQVSILDSRVRG